MYEIRTVDNRGIFILPFFHTPLHNSNVFIHYKNTQKGQGLKHHLGLIGHVPALRPLKISRSGAAAQFVTQFESLSWSSRQLQKCDAGT